MYIDFVRSSSSPQRKLNCFYGRPVKSLPELWSELTRNISSFTCPFSEKGNCSLFMTLLNLSCDNVNVMSIFPVRK